MHPIADQPVSGNTALIQLRRLVSSDSSVLMAKMECDNPSGSVKDRVVQYMIDQAEVRGDISPGDTLICATTGSSGIALAMAARRRGYRSISVVPDDIPAEMSIIIGSLGAELITVSGSDGIQHSQALALELSEQGVGYSIDEYTNMDSPKAHYLTTAPEIWTGTKGRVTHFVSAAGSFATLMGVGSFLKEKNPDVQIVGVRATEGAFIPGMPRWPDEHEPPIYLPGLVDEWFEVSSELAIDLTRKLGQEEGVFAGISAGATVAIGSRLCRQAEHRTVVCIICDRGDRYLSTGIYD